MRASELYDFYTQYSFDIFCKNFNTLIFENKIEAVMQNDFDSSYYSRKMVTFDEVEIDFDLSSVEISNRYHAMFLPTFQIPTFQGKKIKFISICSTKSLGIGQLSKITDTSFFVGTQDFDLLLVMD